MKIITKDTVIQLIKYAKISIISYSYVFLSLYLLVELLDLNESIAFMIVYGILYALLYFIQMKYLFNTSHSKKKLIRFILAIATFYVLANLLYNLGIYLKINYLISTVITIAILMPLRFLTYKYVVYK